MAHELTGIFTLQASGDETGAFNQQPFGFVQFMVDCAVILNHTVARGVSRRNLRVQKYRGSSFNEDEAPFLIGTSGIEVTTAPRTEETNEGVTGSQP